MKHCRVVFMGTPDFAVPCLKILHENCEVAAVITQPDRPRGRGQKMQPSAVKAFAASASLSVLQPEKIKTPEFTEKLREMKPDLIVVVAFGQILSKEILAIPPLGCVNVHASLLPRYRGAAPIHWAIIKGEKESGVTTMFMDEGLDTGDMILMKKCDISQEMLTGELHDALMAMGADLLLETVAQLTEGKAARTVQDHEASTYAPLLKKTTEKIDWSLPAAQIHNLVRGLNPWPGAYCMLEGKVLKIWRTRCAEQENHSAAPGEVIGHAKDGCLVQTGDGVLEIVELQPAGKRKMAAKDYMCGGALAAGSLLV